MRRSIHKTGPHTSLVEERPLPASLRIGLFSESFHPVQNGVTTSLLTLLEGLRSHQHRVWVFAPENELQKTPETNVLRFPSFVTAYNREYPLAYPFYPRLALATHFSRLRLDIVHTHTPFVLGLTGARMAISRGIPLVSTYHTLYSQYTHYLPVLPDPVTQGLLDVYLPWYYNRCAEVICPSLVAANALRNQGVESPICVIPTGIPLPPPEAITEPARLETRRRLDLPPAAPIALYAGRLSEEKNIGWLLELWGGVRRRVPEAILAIAGGGPHAEELKRVAESLGIAASVRFLGLTPRRQMDSLFAAADVFCFPSPSETQGLVIGEARAAGTPGIVVDAGGAPETITEGEDGFRIPAGDSEAFTDRVVQVLTDTDLRRRLRENARRNAEAFTPAKMIERILSAYERAHSRPPRISRLGASILTDEWNWEAFGSALREKVRKQPTPNPSPDSEEL